MEEINLKELFDYFKERILIIIIIILLVLVAGSVYSIFLKVPMYQSSATLVLVSDDGTAGTKTTYTQSDVTLNQSLVTTYSEIVKSRRILETVIKKLALDYTYEQLYDSVTVTNQKDTEIIKVSVKDADKAIAADVTNEIIKAFGDEIKNIYRLQNVSIVDKAVEAQKAYNINMVKDLAIYLLVGIVFAMGIIFVIYYFDTTIKSADEIERKLGLPVYGIVPRVKHKDKK